MIELHPNLSNQRIPLFFLNFRIQLSYLIISVERYFILGPTL